MYEYNPQVRVIEINSISMNHSREWKIVLMPQESDRPYFSLEITLELEALYSRLHTQSYRLYVKQMTDNFCLLCFHRKRGHRRNKLVRFFLFQISILLQCIEQGNSTAKSYLTELAKNVKQILLIS